MIYEVGMNTQSCSCQMRPDRRQEAGMTGTGKWTGKKLSLIGKISCQEVEGIFLLPTLSGCYNWNLQGSQTYKMFT